MDIILDVRLYKDGQTKDELYRHINIHDNKRKNIRKEVNVDMDTQIYDMQKYIHGSIIIGETIFHYQVTFIKIDVIAYEYTHNILRIVSCYNIFI